jgi:hypothetical protein
MSAIPTEPVQRVLDRVEAVRPQGKGWEARCPAHDDNRRSLTIAVGDEGRALVRCHAGCSTDAVVAAVQLQMRDLFPPRQPEPALRGYQIGNGTSRAVAASPKKKAEAIKPTEPERLGPISATYDYNDEAGVLLFQVVRHEPKDFRQRRPDGNGGWIRNMEGVRRELYRLPEARQAVSSGKVLVIAEGEKAADAVRDLGIAATCSPGGAKKYRDEYSDHLAGAHVVILPDNDDPGREHAAMVAASVMGKAKSVRVVTLPGLPEKGDVFDWIAAGGTREKLEQLIREAPPLSANGSRPEASVTPVAEEWPEPGPLPDGLPPVPPFVFDLLPETMRPWVADIADRMQCPPDFIAASVMVALGSLAARRAAIRPKANDDWTVIPNLWGVAVGAPGVLKTPAIADGLKPLKRLEAEESEAHEEQVRLWEARQLMAAADKVRQQEEVKKELKNPNVDRDALARRLAANMPETVEPPRTRHIVNDATVEALSEILRDNRGGILAYRDELMGLFYQLDKDGQEPARAFYLEGWVGGQSYESNRIGRGHTKVRDNTLSLLGGVQPGPLRAYLRGGTPGAQDDGLVQRLQLIVWPDISPEWTNVDRLPEREARERAYTVFARLARIDAEALVVLGAERDPFDAEARPFFRFTSEAQAEFDVWRGDLERRVRSEAEAPAFRAHLSKYRSLVPSLALIVHLAEGLRGPVGLEAVLVALEWVKYLEGHAGRVYAGVTGQDATPTRALAAKLRSGVLADGFTARDVYRRKWSELHREAVRDAVDELERLGWLRSETLQTEGRWTTKYRINPGIREGR